MANKDEAVIAMRTAQQYLEKTANDSSKRERDEWLKFAAQYAAKAKALDPEAILTFSDNGSYLTIDHLTARILFIEAVFNYGTDYKADWKKAAAALEKAIAYYPQATYYQWLAKTYAKLHRRVDAIKALETSFTVEPNNFETRSMLDKMGANPAIGAKPSIFASHPGLFIGFGILIGLGGLLYWIVSPVGLIIAIIGGLMFVAGKFSENQKGLLDAIDNLDGQVRNTL